MNLLFHIGTEKTGSSFLQTLLVSSRKHLEENGIHFPKDPNYESRMRKGEVGPGNAIQLHYALQRGEKFRVRKLLDNWIADAISRNCETLLLSNETMTAVLQEAKLFQNFQRHALSAGVSSIRLLLVLRDPVDQALSLYKHRAKFGKAPAVEHWVSENYDVDRQLAGTMENIKMSSFAKLDLHRYSSNGKLLAKNFFCEWLGVDRPQFHTESRINTSLSLEELEIIRLLAKTSPDLVPIMYRKFQQLPRESRASDRELEDWHRAVLSRTLVRSEELWQRLSMAVPGQKCLSIPKSKPDLPSEPPHISLSRMQIEQFVNLINMSSSIRFQLYIQVKKCLSPFVSPIRKKLQALIA